MVSCGAAKGRTDEMNWRAAMSGQTDRLAQFSAQRWRGIAPAPPGDRPGTATPPPSPTPASRIGVAAFLAASRAGPGSAGGEHARRDRDRDIPAEDGRHRADADRIARP